MVTIAAALEDTLPPAPTPSTPPNVSLVQARLAQFAVPMPTSVAPKTPVQPKAPAEASLPEAPRLPEYTEIDDQAVVDRLATVVPAAPDVASLLSALQNAQFNSFMAPGSANSSAPASANSSPSNSLQKKTPGYMARLFKSKTPPKGELAAKPRRNKSDEGRVPAADKPRRNKSEESSLSLDSGVGLDQESSYSALSPVSRKSSSEPALYNKLDPLTRFQSESIASLFDAVTPLDTISLPASHSNSLLNIPSVFFSAKDPIPAPQSPESASHLQKRRVSVPASSMFLPPAPTNQAQSPLPTKATPEKKSKWVNGKKVVEATPPVVDAGIATLSNRGRIVVEEVVEDNEPLLDGPDMAHRVVEEEELDEHMLLFEQVRAR